MREPGSNAASPETNMAPPEQTVAFSGRAAPADSPSGASPLTLRACGLLVAACCGAILTVAAILSPNPSGTGTHRQLGLPACSFLAQTGWPCPSCGLTTSMADMARGQVARAWKAHPFGVALFAAVAVLAIAGTVQLLTGRNVLTRLGRARWWVLGTIIGLASGWIVVLLTGLAEGTLPLR